MKKTLKIVSVILSALIISTSVFAGCSNGGGNNGNKISGTVTENYANASVRNDEYIVYDGKSEYVIVIPYTPTEYEVYAAKELVALVKESTGVELQITSDSGKSFSKDKKYISIGNTSLVEESGVLLYEDYLLSYGARVATKGNCVFLYGRSDRFGIIFSVYRFLRYVAGFESYTFGVYDIQKSSSLNMYDLDVVYKPANGLLISAKDEDYGEALRMEMGVENALQFKVKLGGHNLPVLIYPGTYKSEHPDWFAKDSTIDQLCLSNEEMWDELAKNLFSECIKTDNRTATVVELAMGDGGGYCHCDRCLEIIAAHDGKVAATMIPMLNSVGDKVDALLKEAGDTRTMEYNFLCYNEFDDPPVKKNKNGEYEPLDESCVLNENRYIKFAPMYVEYCNRLDDKNSNVNKIEIEKFKGWQAISSKTAFFGYGANFENYVFGFNNFGGLQSLAKEMKNLNVEYAKWDGMGSPFILCELQTYLTQNILAEPEQDINALIEKFCNYYYKDAKDAIIEYYETVRAHYANLQKDQGLSATCYTQFSSNEWPYSLIKKMESILNKAFEAIKKYEETDPNLYLTLYNRVNKETMTYRYANLSWYWGYYSRSQRAEMIDSFESDCALYGITDWRNETYGRIDRKIAEFRGNLSVG